MQKHILFISYDGMTDPLGQSQVIPYLQGLSAAGYNISLLSCEKPEVYHTKKKNIEYLLQASNIQWHPIQYTKKPAVLSTLYDIYQLKKIAKKIYKQQPYQMVHTRIGIPSLVGLWLKKKYGVLFLNDIREFYADSRVDGGMWNLSSPLYKIIYKYFKKQEGEQVKHSDGIVCLTQAAKRIIVQWPQYNPATPIEVIPCSADLNLFDSQTISQDKKNEYAKKWGIQQNDIVISYLGSIGGWYLTKEMLELCKYISDKIPNTKFLFISPHRHEQIIEHARQFNISESKIITTQASRNEVPLFLSLSNFSLFFIKPCYSKLSSSPTKHGEIMAMGIPVITNSGVGDVAEIVTETNSGIVINEFTWQSFKQVAELLLQSNFSGNRIREGAKKIYALDNAIESYKRMYKKLLG